MKVLKNNLAKNDIFVISGYGPFILYARQNTGLLWHNAVHPSVHASYDNISHLFPLLLIGHVVTYIVLIKGEQVRGVILVNLENASFHMVHVYTINWFKKVQNINYCSHAAQPTFNCHKRRGSVSWHSCLFCHIPMLFLSVI